MDAVLEAVKRDTRGKNAARRLRAAGQIPAVLYGAQKGGDQPDPEAGAVGPKTFLRILHSDSGFNTLITLKVKEGGDARVLVKNVQLDPITNFPLHADFYRVNMDRKLTVTVPVVIRGEARGVKVDGGILDFVHREIQLECLPSDIPNAIEVDITALGIGDSVHVRDLAASAAWTAVGDPDLMLLQIIAVKVVEEVKPAEGAAAAAPVAGATAAEPEVIKKGKTDEAKADEKKK